MKSYIIFTTPRTGSYLLCDLFAQTRALGKPNEFLNPVLEPRFTDKWNIPSDPKLEYIAGLKKHTSTRNKVFGIKITARQLMGFEKNMGEELPNLSLAEALQKAFPDAKFIRLVRDNKIKQAISLAKAQQNKVWRLNKDAEGPKRIEQVNYAEGEIKKSLNLILKQERYLDSVINDCGKQTLSFSYEQVTGDTASVIENSLDFLSVSSKLDISTIQPGTKKLSNTQSDKWYQSFLSTSGKWADKRINKYRKSIQSK